MTNSVEKTITSPHEEAAFWQSRLMSGAMLEQERVAFEAWLAESDENRTAFSEIERALEVIDEGGVDALAREFEDELEMRAQRAEHRHARYAAIAASLVLVCTVIAGLALRSFSPSEPQLYATAIGQIEKVGLKDGSVIELNTQSAIEVAYQRDFRGVSLTKGQALFTVERDTTRPFVVATEQADIVVTGTVFDIDIFDGDTVVSVVSGVVDVRPSAGGSVTLLAGDKIVVTGEGVAGPVERFDANQTIAWRHGKLRYREAPLGTVVEDLNRYFEKPIDLADANLAMLPVTGEFETSDQAAAVRGLSLSFSLSAEEEADRIVLSGSAD